MNVASLKETITFQFSDDQITWTDYLTTHAYINGVSGKEYYLANAGDEGVLTVNVECRYQSKLMKITPMQYRIVHNGNVYNLLSPADDVQMRHKTVKFRARREYYQEDGVIPNGETYGET